MKLLKKLFDHSIVKYLFSYLVVFTVLISGFFFILKNQLKEQYFNQLRENTQMQLNAFAVQLNKDISYLHQIDSDLTADESLLLFRYYQDISHTRQAITVLRKYDTASSLINSISYIPMESDNMLSTNVPISYKDGKFVFYCSSQDTLSFDPQPYYNNSYRQLIFLTDGKYRYLLYWPQNTSTGKYVRFFSLDLIEIQQRLNHLITNDVPAIALISPNKEVITGINEELLLPYLDSGISNETNFLYLQEPIGNEYSLVILLSTDSMAQHINASFASAYTSLLFLSIMAFLLIFWVMKFTYFPLRRLAKKTLSDDPLMNQTQNKEYIQLLDTAFTQKSEQNELLQCSLNKYRDSMHKALLESTLSNYTLAETNDISNIDYFFDPDVKSEIFVIWMATNNIPFPTEAIKSYLLESLHSQSICIILEAGKCDAVFLLNYMGKDIDKLQVIKTLLYRFYEEHGILSAISNGSKSPLDISLLYKNAKLAAECWSNTPVADFSLLASEETSLLYPHESLNRLSEILKTDDFQATPEIESLFCLIDNAEQTSYPFTEFFIKSILVDILTIIADCMNQFEVKFKTYSDLFFETLYLCRSCSYTENKWKIKENIQKLLVHHTQEMAARIIHPSRVVRIMEESYCDPEFSIYALADMFHISVAYMSYLFKKELNQNFSDYLWTLRLAKAKELLADTELPIEEVSIRVGYSSLSGFRRKFKQDVGMTPTQYREMIQKI